MAPPIIRCWDLTDVHIREAIGSRRAMGALLKEMTAAARPGDGAPKILLAIARLAEPGCEWLEGFVRVEIAPVDSKTQITVTEDLGAGLREVVFPRMLLDAPIEEFERSLRLAPQAIEPLVQQKDTDKVVLVQPGRGKAKSRPAFELAEDCLRDSLPPAVKKSLPPPAKPAGKPIAPRISPAPRPAPPKAQAFPNEAPTKKMSRPAQHPKLLRDGAAIMEIPRAPKVLDFGDLTPARPAAETPKAATAAETPKKQPSRIPPKPKKPSRIPPAKGR